MRPAKAARDGKQAQEACIDIAFNGALGVILQDAAAMIGAQKAAVIIDGQVNKVCTLAPATNFYDDHVAALNKHIGKVDFATVTEDVAPHVAAAAGKEVDTEPHRKRPRSASPRASASALRME